MSLARTLYYLSMPARLTVLILIGFVSLCLWLSLHAGLVGIPLLLAMLSWIFSYAYVLLERMAHGAREPPVLAIEMLNPAHEPRALLHSLIVLVGAVLLYWLHVRSALLATLLAWAALGALPACIAVLALGDRLWHALHPLVLWRTARAQGWAYVLIVGMIALYALLLWLTGRLVPSFLLQCAAAVFAWLSIYALIGGSIFEHRAALGYEPVDSPEQRAHQAALELQRSRQRLFDTIYHQARGGNLTGAWRSIEQAVLAHGYAAEFCDWLLERLRTLPDPRLAERLAQRQITHALGNDNPRAVRLAQAALGADPAFRPASAAETLRLAELLRLSADRVRARLLLADFELHFSDPAAREQATQLARELQ